VNDRFVQNPFRDAVVQDAWQAPVDVPEIHHRAFCECQAVIETARGGVPDSLLLYGPAGSGKTHLLTRLQRHLHQSREEATDRPRPCVFVFVRLQTSSRMLWQHVRRRFVSDLTRGDQGYSQLERLLAHRLALRLAISPSTALREFGTLRETSPELLLNELEVLRESAQLPRDLAVILEHLVFDRKVRDASAWLMGESLPEATLAELGLGADLSTDREQAAREMMTLLCRLVATTMPVVFCFDQIEALQRNADDREAFFHFAQMAADLHDSAASVGLITCLQSAVLDQFKCAVRQADFQRIAKRHAVLHSLTRHQVSALVLSRLELVPSLREQAGERPYYPFTSQFVANLADEAPSVPRRIFHQCARQFDELQDQSVHAPPSMEEFLAAELAARRLQALQSGQAGESLRVLMHALPALAGLCGAEIGAEDPEGIADWVLYHGGRPMAVTVRNEADGRTLSPKLKALLEHSPRRDGAPWVLLRDRRLSLSKAAVRTRERLSELEAKGARLVEPSLETLASLDALQSLLGDAASGDLARGGEAVESSTVLGWLKAGLNIGADELESVLRFWCAVTGTQGAPADTGAITALAVLQRARGDGDPTARSAPGRAPLAQPRQAPPATPDNPERLEADLATFETGHMPIEAALAAYSMSAGGESAQPAPGANFDALSPGPSARAHDASSRRTFWSWLSRRRQDKAQRSDVAAASRLASLLRG
jgi:AAA ATPase-like protein